MISEYGLPKLSKSYRQESASRLERLTKSLKCRNVRSEPTRSTDEFVSLGSSVMMVMVYAFFVKGGITELSFVYFLNFKSHDKKKFFLKKKQRERKHQLAFPFQI